MLSLNKLRYAWSFFYFLFSSATFFITNSLILKLLSLILVILIFLSIKQINFFKINSINRRWAFFLFLYAVIDFFCILYHFNFDLNQIDQSLFEIGLRYFFGSIISVIIINISFNKRLIKYGLIIGTVSICLMFIIFFESGNRFSPFMNPTKFSALIALQATLICSMIYLSKDRAEIIFLIFLTIINIFILMFTGTRSIILPILLILLLMFYILIQKNFLNYLKIFFLILFISLSLSQVEIFKNRFLLLLSEIQNIKNYDFDTSLGQRIIMYKAGINAFAKNPIIGSGYNYKKIIEKYSTKENFQKKIVKKITNRYSNFHNIFLDELAKKGIIGFFSLILLLYSAINFKNKTCLILTGSFILTFILMGLTDSITVLSVTSTYFIVQISFLRSICINEKNN